jgi:site-specific recombinase XerD
MVGPLAPLAGDLRRQLADRGYSVRSAAELMRLVARLSCWLEARGVAAGEVSAAEVEEFFVARRAEGARKWLTARSLGPLMKALGIAPADTVGGVPVEGLLAQYREYLRSERGLAPSTVGQYLRCAATFLSWPPAAAQPGPSGLTAQQITVFVMSWSGQHNASQARMMVNALRSLLRFLHVSGIVTTSLVDAVPSVPGWGRVRVPRGVEADEIAAVLAGCDRLSALGRRDYAIILLLARLGLRAGEVAAVRIADVAWRAGELTVRGKGNRLDVLPLPVDVGQALADYVQHARPRTPADAFLFVRAIAPFGAMHPGTINALLHRACKRANVAAFGPHRLRHAVATALLAQRASLEEIGQLLRQSDQTTTAVYAKADLARLSELAMPCPQAIAPRIITAMGAGR